LTKSRPDAAKNWDDSPWVTRDSFNRCPVDGGRVCTLATLWREQHNLFGLSCVRLWT
jgi:hypothetical protein